FFAARDLPPVWVREVGFGLSAADVQRLESVGVAGFDVGGQGGTSWTGVEAEAATDESHAQLGRCFWDWGLSTPETILEVRSVTDKPVVATGGVRSGLDVARCLALGADVASMAAPILKAAVAGEAALD